MPPRGVLPFTCLRLRQFAKLAAGPRDAGLDGCLGQTEDLADLAIAQIVHGFEQQRLAISIGQARGEFEQAFTFPRVGGHTLGRGGCFARDFDLRVE